MLVPTTKLHSAVIAQKASIRMNQAKVLAYLVFQVRFQIILMVPLSVRNALKIFNQKILVQLNVLLVVSANVQVKVVLYVKIVNLEKQAHRV